MILHEIMLSISKTNILNIFITSKTNYLNFFRGYLVKIFYFYYLKQSLQTFLTEGHIIYLKAQLVYHIIRKMDTANVSLTVQSTS